MNPFDDALRQWSPVRRYRPGELTDARLQAHWAIQLVDVVGRRLVPEQDDFAHLSLTWLPPLGILAGGFTEHGLRAGLRLRDLSLAVLDADDRVEWSLPLDGKTLAEATEWLQGVLIEEGEARVDLEPGREDLPEHAVARGEPFHLDEREHFAQLSLWFGNLATILEVLSHNTLGARPARAWPHHFDLATLIQLEPEGADEEKDRSINVGLSPGDGSYDEPYLYVTPWPPPGSVETTPLDGNGHWHTDRFTAAVLPSHRLPDTEDSNPDGRAQVQAEQAFTFLRSAICACRSLLGTL